MSEGLLRAEFARAPQGGARNADDVARLDALRSLDRSRAGIRRDDPARQGACGRRAQAVDKRLTRLRVAMLSSGTIDHLVPALARRRLRRGFFFDVFAGAFGQYRQELLDPATPLQAFEPDVVVLSLSARALVGVLPIDADPEHVEQLLREPRSPRSEACGKRRAQRFGAVVLQQTYLDMFEPIFGSYDRIARCSAGARDRSAQRPARAVGSAKTVSRSSMPRARVRGTASMLGSTQRAGCRARWRSRRRRRRRYGELVARMVAAQRGRSRKCLVLDLDNTLWGGVMGDDGLEGMVLGEGSAAGEAHLALQRYAPPPQGARRDPRRLLEERPDDRRAGLQPAPRDGAEAFRHRLLRRQLEGQGREPAGHRRSS